MLINGQPFTATTEPYHNLRRLRASAGNCTLLPEFCPVRFPHSTHIRRFLHDCFFCQDICCLLAGNFVLHMAGIFDTYNLASLFIAMSDSPFLQRLFQQDPDLPGNFYDHGFLFQFLHVDVVEDIFYYDISYDHEFKMSFVVCGVDTTENCNPSSNLDFVLYMAKLRTFHFCQILSDLCSQRLSNPTRTGMSKTLQGGIRRVERRYTLPRTCHQDSKHYVP